MAAKQEILLSLDQGTQISGYAVYEGTSLLTSGTVASKIKDSRLRMFQMCQNIIEIIKEYQPNRIIIEEPFAKNNIHVFQVLCEFFGMILYIANDLDIPLTSYSAAVWRAEIELKGKNRQEQKIKAMDFVKTTFDIDCSDDEAEAILIGYSHLKREKLF